MGQAQALSGLLSLNAWDVGCNTRAFRHSVWKSLPKQRETAEKGRESQACLLEISTQTAIFAGER